jgi:cytochrome c-type biogenesis protein CcmF
MMLVMMVGPLLRWRGDSWDRLKVPVAILTAITVTIAVLVMLLEDIAILPHLGVAVAIGLAVASFLPLRGRKLLRVPIATWGMVIAHFGLAVAVFGMASESAFTKERLVAVKSGEVTQVGDWNVTLETVDPVAGPNWTALEARLLVQRGDGEPAIMNPQERHFWAPAQETTESALLTRWDGQFYAVLGNPTQDGRWQLNLWWKPFVTFIWYGGLLISFGGVLAIIGRLAGDLRRRRARHKGAERRAEVSALKTQGAAA